MAFESVMKSINLVTNTICGLVTTGFGVSLMVSQKDYTDALKSSVKAQTRILDYNLDQTKKAELLAKQQSELEQELVLSAQRYANGVADDEDLTLLATYLPDKFANIYVDKDTKQAVITVSSNQQDNELEDRALNQIQNNVDFRYITFGAIGLFALYFILRRK